MFPDFNKYSVQQYSEIFSQYYQSSDSSILPDGLVLDEKWSGKYMGVTLTGKSGSVKIFENGDFVFVPSGTERPMHLQSASKESLSTQNVGYTKSKSKGLEFKFFVLDGVNYSSSKTHKKYTCNESYNFWYSERHHVKHIIRDFYTSTGRYDDAIGQVTINERVRKKDRSVLNSKLSIDRVPGFKDRISIYLDEYAKNRVRASLQVGYDKEYTFDLKFPDANIVHLFDFELMWDFDLIADIEVFKAVDALRKYVPEKLKSVVGSNACYTALQNISNAENMEE